MPPPDLPCGHQPPSPTAAREASVTHQNLSETLKIAIAQTVDGFTDQIRAKARSDHADELAQAGYTDAADYLRNNR